MLRKVLSTDSGMWGLWDCAAYTQIDSYDEWDKLFCEDENIQEQIIQNTFVPINIRRDGSFEFQVKIDTDLDKREQQYLLVKSKPYLFYTKGKIKVSGIEKIGKDIKDNDCITIDIQEGKYVITVCLIQWDKEPNMKLENGSPRPEALPDFIILVNSINNEILESNKNIETFASSS